MIRRGKHRQPRTTQGQILFTSTWGYLFNVGILGFVGAVESGRICSAIPDWASALLIPLVPFIGAMSIGYLGKHVMTQESSPKQP